MLKLSFILVILLLAEEALINGEVQKTTVRTDIKGRLLSPNEGCGYSKVANTRIVGGGPAKNGAWPWMVLLIHDSSYILTKCGGSLITTRHVLTAAHCLELELNYARLGEYDTETESDGEHEDVAIARKIPHENYDRDSSKNDIAIMELERDVTFNDRISPICLPSSEHIKSRSWAQTSPFVAGWGTLEMSGRYSKILHQAQLQVITNAECQEMYKNIGEYSQLNDNVLCVRQSQGGADACQGDSGGPLMLPVYNGNGKFPYYQLGIISNGIGCGMGYPGVHTNVSSHVDWIQSKLQ